MATYGLTTLGVQVFKALSPNGIKITDSSAYTEFTRVNSMSEVGLEANNTDVSALIDKVTRYAQGRSDVSDTLTITVNTTDETEAEWNAVLGKKLCILIKIPGLTKQIFIIVQVPAKLPMPAIEQNSNLTYAINCTVNDYIGFDTPVSGISGVSSITLSESTLSLTVGQTERIIATTTPSGQAVTWSSSDSSVAEVTSSGYVVGTGAGTAVITASNGDASATCTVTVASE